MEAKRHIVVSKETGKVVNVVMHAGSEWLPPRGHYIIQVDEGDIDDSFDFVTRTIIRRDRTAKDATIDAVKALEAEITIKNRELAELKARI